MSSTPDFMRYAPCAEVGPEVMFPPPGDLTGLTAAKKVCTPCEFREQCLSYALSPKTRIRFGVVGGKSERERRKIRKPPAHAYDVGPLPPKSKRHALSA
ncbi:WhiB family transcriptional regulator [Streptomyces griseoluteus]|uniref:WhiB family transcriptional regulator n=1 Tax=Streptomyces griseoluteus TaxID=29306 RepID=UPI00340C1E9D